MKAHWLTKTSAATLVATLGAYACGSLHGEGGTKAVSPAQLSPPSLAGQNPRELSPGKADPLTPASTESPEVTPPHSEEDKSSAAQQVPPELPSDLKVGEPEDVHMEGDRPLRITHAGANQTHAIVYLHGMCGNPRGADRWADLAAERGTLIVVRATVPCPDRPGFKWPKDLEEIQTRIDAALAFVANQRGGLLDQDVVTLIGYSQGANRAEKLAAMAPERYPLVVLGGPPTEPTPDLLHSTQRVAILGGELEDTTHMELGDFALRQAGVPSHFFLLPGAHHGDYGPDGRRVIAEAFSFLDGND